MAFRFGDWQVTATPGIDFAIVIIYGLKKIASSEAFLEGGLTQVELAHEKRLR